MFIFTALFCLFLGHLHADENEYQFLDRLAIEAGTDKSSTFHNYTEVYAQYFAPLRNRPLKFLEIGIYKGESVRLWENYFPYADLSFIDLKSHQIEYYSPRAKYYFLDQGNARALHEFASVAGGEFDIIIDDGGHMMHQQIVSFQTLFPFLRSGGLYVVEDLHTSYWKAFGGRGSHASPLAGPGTAIDYFKHLVDDLNRTGATMACSDWAKVPLEKRQTFTEMQKSVYSIHFYDSLCIIKKR